jgi:hypothetical protein
MEAPVTLPAAENRLAGSLNNPLAALGGCVRGLAGWHLARPARGEPPIGRNGIPLSGANPPEPRTI